MFYRFIVSSRGLLGALLASTLCSAALAQAPVDGLIVKLKDATPHERMQALDAGKRATESGKLQRVIQASRMTEVRTRAAGRAAQHLHFGRQLRLAEAQALADRLRSQPEVEWVELNARERLLQAAAPVPNDLYYGYVSPTDPGQWWLRPPGESDAQSPASWGAPGVQNAWRVTTGHASAIVAVLDTGKTEHADLRARFLQGFDFVSEVEYAADGNGRDTDPSDPGDWVTDAESQDPASPFFECAVQHSSWHGTVISGIVAAQTDNRGGVAGINWDGRVLPVRVAGRCGATVADIVDGMRWAAGLEVAGAPMNTNPARVINLSFGGSAPCDHHYQEAIDELARHGAVVVAAAGNEQTSPTRPASCAGVVGVAALARDGFKAWYSNFGARVVISTVGGDNDVDDGILTVSNTGLQSPDADSYARYYGTSFSTPIVSGVVSLMLSANAQLSVPQIISGLQVTARPHVQSASGLPLCSATAVDACQCTTSTCGAGILDAEAAVRYAAGAPPDTGGNDDSGGGALGWLWLLGLAAGVVAVRPRGRGH
jgi:serine protease